MKTLRILIIIVLSITQVPVSMAQTFGIKGGLTLYNMYAKPYYHDIDALENNPGIHLGATAESQLSKVFSLSTGLIFTTKGYKYHEEYPSQEHFVTLTGKEDLCYLDIPFTAKLHYDIKNARIYEFFGNYIGVGLFGNGEYTAAVDNKVDMDNYNTKFGSKQRYKRIDFGLSFGAGVEIQSFVVEFSYNLGVKEITRGPGGMKNRVLNLSVGYKFSRN